MTSTPTADRRLFRFSLRGLLIFVAVCGLICWVCLIGLPWLQDYCERLHFESRVKKLTIWMGQDDIGRQLASFHENRRETIYWTGSRESPPQDIIWAEAFGYYFKGATYHVCFVNQKDTSWPDGMITQIEVLRSPPALAGKVDDAKHKSAKQRCELIYADPPAKQLDPQNQTDPLH